MKKLISFVLGAALMLQGTASLRAGGVLETFDITGFVPSPIPGHIRREGDRYPVGRSHDSRPVPDEHDARSRFRIRSALPFLTVAAAQAALQASLDQWNNIPTSYIDMQIVGTTWQPGPARVRHASTS